jgi:triosephosphate isomerase
MKSIQTPLIIVNFKTYAEALGKRGIRLSKIAEKVSLKTGICIAVSPQFTDINNIVERVDVPVLAQHVDPIFYGSNTGHILPEAIKEAGVVGTLINHSERSVQLKTLSESIDRIKEVGLISVVCGSEPNIVAEISKFSPDYVAIEPPELIGTGIPVSKAKPEIVTDTVRLVKKINPTIKVLCGAGITKGEDVVAALRLGTQGILIASGVVKVKDQYNALFELAESMKQ